MCNLYAVTKGQQAIRELARAILDGTGNLPLLPGIFPDYAAPIVQKHRRRPGTDDGTVGNAIAGFCPEGPQLRSGRHQCLECRVAALASLAGHGEPVPRPIHELLRERSATEREPSADLVRHG
jgi:hypothetical protein